MDLEDNKDDGKASQGLHRLSADSPHTFVQPIKRINDGEDVSFFLASKAYADLMTFLLQLNASMFPHKDPSSNSIRSWELGAENIVFSSTVKQLRDLISRLEALIEEAPPDTGPRRFGNISFRKWYNLVEERASDLVDQHVPVGVLNFTTTTGQNVTVKDELCAYLLGSFGSAQRLDYGTGHELSFLAFLGCIWKLGGFAEGDAGVEERNIVLGVIEPYLNLIRRLVLTYTLEPAGSHGVWGLDDHFFIPYIFGSAELSPAALDASSLPQEGSRPGAPDPSDVAKATVVERERKQNMYFSAIGFIYDVKKGPFWEHSPMLFDISGVRAGWAKINKGMIKMYNAEVLSKFPVVQHFPFGSLFPWERDPSAIPVKHSIHVSNQPSQQRETSSSANSLAGSEALNATKAPWASAAGATSASSTRFRTQAAPSGNMEHTSTKAPWAAPTSSNRMQPSAETAAPWTRKAADQQQGNPILPTRAPWAEK
ncbi:MAG: Serine/threonine-protein phosphatase 2A activator 1 [Bathelium mastoideum]|nr:MAG: Serine/threonine-protein phosphatase 2A activator 1 [Bathelium mastoideum]KAI9691025.1 MAG: Serine/threonine-protein phosphatase 2A activator 1 [Bathelium mastoideum]